MRNQPLKLVVPNYAQATDEKVHYRIALYNAFETVSHYQVKADACGLSLVAYCNRFGIKLPKMEVVK